MYSNVVTAIDKILHSYYVSTSVSISVVVLHDDGEVAMKA